MQNVCDTILDIIFRCMCIVVPLLMLALPAVQIWRDRRKAWVDIILSVALAVGVWALLWLILAACDGITHGGIWRWSFWLE